MDDIAAGLSMSKKTLYKAFANKDEIVQAVISDHLRKVQADFARVGDRAANAVEKTVLLARWADEHFEQVHPSIIHDLRKYHPVTWALFREHQSCFMLELISRNLHRGIAEGVFRPDLDVAVLARLQLGLVELVFDLELYPPDQFLAPHVHRIIDEHFLLGIATPHGQQLFAEYRRQPQAAS